MPLPALKSVTSSNIAALGHDGSTLFVRFNNGQVWKYEGVTAEMHNEMKGSASIGSFFHHQIKAHHKGEKVTEDVA